MLPRAGPRVPSRFGRPPRSPARPGRPGAPPAARPCRRTGGRDRLLLRKFQVRKQGHTFPGEGQLGAEQGRASSAGLSSLPTAPAGRGCPGAEPRQESPGSRMRELGTGLAGVPRAPRRPCVSLPLWVLSRSPTEKESHSDPADFLPLEFCLWLADTSEHLRFVIASVFLYLTLPWCLP